MSYFQYKPLNKRFKEFLGIVLATAVSGFIGGAFAMIQAGNTSFTFGNQESSNVLTYAFIGAIVGLVISVLVVNTSRKSGE